MLKKYNNYLVVGLISIILLSAIYYVYPRKNKRIFINNVGINVEIPKNDIEKMRGLMNRDKLDKNSGMLFPYEKEGYYSFWMKNTLIPLDMLWIDQEGKIVHIEHSAPPCKEPICPSYKSPKKAKYVLELSGGFSIENNVKVDDKVNLSEIVEQP